MLREVARRAEAAGLVVAFAAGHRSGRTIPFGALAPLLPPTAAMVHDGIPLLGQVREALAALGGGGPVVLAVDDAHLLDDPSALLISQMASTQAAFVVATVRTDEPEDAATTMWRAGRVERIDLEPLDEPAVGDALASALGDVVDGAAVAALWRASGGNPLFLRELVRGSIAAETLQPRDGVWMLVGEPTTSTRLTELLAAQLAGLTDDEVAVLEAFALDEPAGLDALDAAPGVVDRLEHLGLVEVEVSERRVLVSFVHPVHADAVRARIPVVRGRRLRLRLASSIAGAGTRRRGDVLRVATLTLDGGGEAPADTLLAAGHEAFFANDLVLAERLCRAAHAAAPGFASRHLLADVLYRAGRRSEADEVEATPTAGDGDRALVAINRASGRFWMDGDRVGAEAVLGAAIGEIGDAAWRDELIGLGATFDVNAGEPVAALDRIGGLALAGRPLLQHALVASLALPHVGRAADVLELLPPARAARGELGELLGMHQPGLLDATEAGALLELGRLDDAAAVARRGYADATTARDVPSRAFCALTLARVLLVQGRLLVGLRWAREAAGLFRAVGHRGPLRWAIANGALAAALRGDVRIADAALASLDDVGEHPAAMLRVDERRAAAWRSVAAGEPHRARSVLAAATDECRDRGQRALEAWTLHDRSRLGEARHVVARLAELAERAQGDLLPALAADAAATAADRGTELAASADELERLGARLLAAEAANRACDAFRRAGHRRDATAWSRRAAALASECEGARTPGLARTDAVVPLTERERDIALLAAAGLASKAIAERLILSSRTVDNNLARVYEKLGVSGRSALAEALGIGEAG
jgi:DNA-binding CsgD family transcriptional regulator